MFLLEKTAYDEALETYRSHEARFPLMAAVLSRIQDGKVFFDKSVGAKQYFVQHSFGFSQVFGKSNPEFEMALQRYLSVGEPASDTKVRLYTPSLPAFLCTSQYDRLRSERQRFIWDSSEPLVNQSEALELTGANSHNVGEIDKGFGVVRRFWRSSQDFIDRSIAAVAWKKGVPVAICYAAASAEGHAEIDVITLPESRNQGIGKVVVGEFIRNCRRQGVIPVWDCFTNNAASMALCRGSGFIPASAPYPFFTFTRVAS